MRGSYQPHSLMEIAPLVAWFVARRVTSRWRREAERESDRPPAAAEIPAGLRSAIRRTSWAWRAPALP